MVRLPWDGVQGSLAIPCDIPLYVVPVGDQVEIVVRDFLVPVLGQVDEGAPLSTLALLVTGVIVSTQILLLPVELNARTLELHKVKTTHRNNVESFRVVLLGAVECPWGSCWYGYLCGLWNGTIGILQLGDNRQCMLCQ